VVLHLASRVADRLARREVARLRVSK
jgi:hypothetical protein